jgi:hypothetical protein
MTVMIWLIQMCVQRGEVSVNLVKPSDIWSFPQSNPSNWSVV